LSLRDKIRENQWQEKQDWEIIKHQRKSQYKEEKKETSWNDLPPVLVEIEEGSEEGNSLTFEFCSEILADYLEGQLPTKQTAKVGDNYITVEQNISGLLPKEEKEEESVWKTESEEEEKSKEETVCRYAYEVWTVLQPTHLYPLPNKKWSSPRWKPEIFTNGIWHDASPIDCQNWSKIPKENKRVSYSLGIFPVEKEEVEEIGSE